MSQVPREPAPPPLKKQRGGVDGDGGAVGGDGGVDGAAPPPLVGARPRKTANAMAAACPACGANVKPANVMKHLRSCCPEHLKTAEAAPLVAGAEQEAAAAAAATAADDDAAAAAAAAATTPVLRALLDVLSRQEAEQRRRILKITFMVEERKKEKEEEEQQQKQQPQEHAAAAAAAAQSAPRGSSSRRPLAEVARLMSLPERRAAKMLERAMRTLEMPRDPDPSLRVLHECARFLGVAKPPGVPTTPAHRWRGGSMVNRLLWYGEQRPQAFEPRVLHRLDLDTSGVLLCAKDARAAAAGQAALTGRAGGGRVGGGGRHAEKSYLALAYGWPPPWATGDDDPSAPPPPPGVSILGAGGGWAEVAAAAAAAAAAAGAQGGARALLAFDVDAAIGRHPDSAVGRRVAEDALPSFAAAGGAEEGDKGDDHEDGDALLKFLPASTRFVVLAAAAAAAAEQKGGPGPQGGGGGGAERQEQGGAGGHGRAGAPAAVTSAEPSPLACSASRDATLATFGARAGEAPPRSGRRGCCLVLATLRTGRTHQIRLHLAHAGLPIAGDELYGAPLRQLLPRQALHAWRLALECEVPALAAAAAAAGPAAAAAAGAPTTVRLDLRAPLPEDMVRAAEALGVPIPAAYLAASGGGGGEG